MDQKHTLEPWAVWRLNSGSATPAQIEAYENGEAEYPVIITAGPDDRDEVTGIVYHEADAERIVACVNALAGMDDPVAEIDDLKAARRILQYIQSFHMGRAAEAIHASVTELAQLTLDDIDGLLDARDDDFVAVEDERNLYLAFIETLGWSAADVYDWRSGRLTIIDLNPRKEKDDDGE